MNPSLKDCFELFEIKYEEKIDISILKKKYHKLCLKYHPDKNNNINDQFLYVKSCYEKLLEHVKNKVSNESNKDEYTIYNYFLSFINLSNLKKMMDWVQKYNESFYEKSIIRLHISVDQLFSKELYLYNSIYIPLWHQSIFLSDIKSYLAMEIDEKDILFYIELKQEELNIKLLENNDILIYCDKVWLNKEICFISISKKIQYEFKVTEVIKQHKYHIIANKGIPRPNKEQIYDITELSSIIFCFV